MTKMVDISAKPDVSRVAKASGFIRLKSATLEKIKSKELPKGDVLAVAKTAAILAIKRTPEIVPLTHPISITSSEVKFKVERGGVMTEVEVKSTGKTGVEMEALVGVAAALLTVWDMVKSFEKDEKGQYPDTYIQDIRVLEKVKG